MPIHAHARSHLLTQGARQLHRHLVKQHGTPGRIGLAKQLLGADGGAAVTCQSRLFQRMRCVDSRDHDAAQHVPVKCEECKTVLLREGGTKCQDLLLLKH